MIKLPKEIKKGNRELIKSMTIVSRPKVGKTRSLMQLPNSLLIDLQDSSGFFDGTAINVKKEAEESGKGPIYVINEIAKSIKAENEKNGERIYDYIIIDTLSDLEEWCDPYATMLYKRTAQGRNFTGNSVVAELEYGGGYVWLRNALEGIIHPFFDLAKYCFIMTSHVKDSSINVRGKSIAVSDINLTGKIKGIIAGKCDAIGTMFRDPKTPNQNILSFQTVASDVITGARPAHISNQEFIISQLDLSTDVLTTYWEKIFKELA